MNLDESGRKLRPFDAARYLDTREAQAEYLTAALETGDPAFVGTALATLARARGMHATTKGANVTTQALHENLSGSDESRLSMLLEIVTALDLRLKAEPKA
ncbi:MAG: putative addiction module antidote protein [Boseongicola sp. SB0677_bin_26]|nr:putative addiction module antidote protein [Boseongicola sp. SB0665_bin_10]MYG25428.1 putative addiction module antidote protein [Boseongicola sp. SB0677_bin_26]